MTANMEMSCASTDDFATMPRDMSGDFLYDEQVAEPSVYELTPRAKVKTIYENNSTKITQRALMTSDGRSYLVSSSHVTSATPDKLPTQYIETTAFLTQPEGMYTRRLINLGRLGIEGTVVSSPQSIGAISSIERNGRNVLSIAQYEAQRRALDSRFMILGGESRGSMTGMSMLRYAEEYGITPLFAHFDAPCVPRGIAEAWEEAVTEKGVLLGSRKAGGIVLRAVIQELLTLNKAIDNDRAANRHMGKTLDTSLRSPIIHTQEAISLLSGDAGEHARYLPTDTFGHVGLANDDALSNPSAWVGILNDYPGITTKVELSGGHLSTIGRTFHENWLENMTNSRDVLREHPELLGLDARRQPEAAVIEFSQHFSHIDPSYKPLPHTPPTAA